MTHSERVHFEEQELIRRISVMLLSGQVTAEHEAIAPSPERDAVSAEASARVARKLLAMLDRHQSEVQSADLQLGAISPKRIVGKPVVTIRHHQKSTTVAFTAALSRVYPITDFKYVSVRAEDGYAEFTLTNDSVAELGTFTLSHNGGSSKATNSPGRIVSLMRGTIRVPSGSYVPTVKQRQDGLVIRIEHAGPGAAKHNGHPESRALRVVR